jgi:hypothetical protein
MFSQAMKSGLIRLGSVGRTAPAVAMSNQWPAAARAPTAAYFSTGGDRPFRILGIQQIALGSTDRAGLNKLWNDIFGLQKDSSHRLEKENVEEDILKVGAPKSPFVVEVDLMCPIDPEKSPKVRMSFKNTVAARCCGSRCYGIFANLLNLKSPTNFVYFVRFTFLP